MLQGIRGIAVTNLFGAFHYFLTIFILSPYLAQFMGESSIGLVFAAGAILSLVGFLVLPFILKRVLLKRVAQTLASVQFIALLGLTFSTFTPLLILCVIILAALPALTAYTLDVFLEQATKDEGSTGNVRGLFITSANIALIISPLAIGFILGDTNAYERVFGLAAASLIPFALLLTAVLPVHANHARAFSLISTLRCLTRSKDVMLGVLGHFIMLLFFSWVAIYIPLYLHTEIGIAWESLGWVFSIMLLPYLLLEYPIGIIADKWFGERELMMVGFAFMGTALAMISFVTAPVITAFLIFILVSTRIGGAITEITTETYFFKHVDGDDINSMSLFRMLRPLGALAGPLIGSFALLFISLQSLFIVLGAICFIGIPIAFLLRDTL